MQHFFRLTFLTLLFPLLVFTTPVQVFAQQPEGTFRIGVYDNPPKVFTTPQGDIDGLFPDILNYIAKQEGWTLIYVNGSFEEGLSRLERGEIDVMVDVAISNDRLTRFDFNNQTVFSSWGVVLVKKGSDIESFMDLDGKKVAILKSSIYLQGPEGVDHYLESFGLHSTLVELDEYSQVLGQLSRGEVDAAVVSRIIALTQLKNYPNLETTNIFFSPTELRFALTKGDRDNAYLIERLDHHLEDIKSSTSNTIYDDILNEHSLLGFDSRVEFIPSWVRYVGIGVFIVILLSWLIILILRKARENALVHLQEKSLLLETIISQVPIAFFAFTPDGRLTLVEGGGEAGKLINKFGILIGHSMFDIFKDNPVVIENINKSLAGNETNFTVDQWGRSWRVNALPLIIGGKIRQIIGAAVDFTAEVELDKEKTEFIQLAAHHLRTPPTEIKWNIENLDPKIEKALEKKDLEGWNEIKNANARMISLANALALSAELELNEFTANSTKVNLVEVIKEQVEREDALVKQKKLDLSIDSPAEFEAVIDKKQIGSVIGVLVSNAVRYSNPGGKIVIKLEKREKSLLITVTDSGMGIPKNQQDQIFNKLFRADNATKADAVGVGLGLYIAKRIVEILSGKISFESEEGRGTSFFVEIPQ